MVTCLFCIEPCETQFCSCNAVAHPHCLTKYIVGEGKRGCPVCRVALQPGCMREAFDHAYEESRRALGEAHPETQLNRLNRASVIAMAGGQREALQELELLAGEKLEATQRIVCRIEIASCLSEIGRSSEAIARLEAMIVELAAGKPDCMMKFFLVQTYLSLGHAHLDAEQLRAAKDCFLSGLALCSKIRVTPAQLPLSKLLQGASICYMQEGRHDLALGCHTIRCKRVLESNADTLLAASAEIEWSQAELRCCKQSSSTATRLKANVRTLRRCRDDRAQELLEEGLSCLDQMWAHRGAKRIRRKTPLEECF